MTQKESGRFVIYSRKSKFTGKGESVENQVEMCRQYIAGMFGQKKADEALVYEDEGFSGGNLERPRFKQMIKDSHNQKFAAIVVYRLDRISRNIGDFAKLIEDLGDRDIDFISIKEQFDTSSPMGRAMMYIASVFSQLERETIAERIRDNMHELAKTGRWLGGNTPTGYASESISNVSVDGKVRKAYKLKPIPKEITLVKKIFDLFVETGSLTKVDQYLLKHGLKTKYGKDFSRFAIRGILTNPVYMMADESAYNYLIESGADLFSDESEFDGTHGIMAYNRTLQRPGKANQINPMSEWIVAVGKHPGIIPGSTWVSVQEKLERNKSKSYRTPRSNLALLSGLLICGSCGDYMRPKMTNRVTADGKPIYTYLCTRKERSRRQACNMKNASGNILDAKVIESIRQIGKSSDEMAKQILQTKKLLYTNRENCNAEVAQVNAQLNDVQTKIKALLDSLATAAGTAAELYIVQQIDELHKSGEQYQNRLKELETFTQQQELDDIEFDTTQRILANFGKSIDDYSIEQKRAVIRACVRQIVWDGENIHLYLVGQNEKIEISQLSVNAEPERILNNDEVPPGEYCE